MGRLLLLQQSPADVCVFVRHLQMNHPNIMILHDFFVEDKFYYLVTEFMEGGELFDRIVEKVYRTTA